MSLLKKLENHSPRHDSWHSIGITIKTQQGQLIILISIIIIIIIFAVLGIKPRVFCMLGKHATIELYIPSPIYYLLISLVSYQLKKS